MERRALSRGEQGEVTMASIGISRNLKMKMIAAVL